MIFFNKGSKSKIYVYIIYIHFFLGGGGEGGLGEGARVSEFFFTKNPTQKKEKKMGGGVGGSWSK